MSSTTPDSVVNPRTIHVDAVLKDVKGALIGPI